MSLHDALRFARRWALLLLLGPVLSALVAYWVVRELPSVYEAQTTVLVGQGSTGSNPSSNDLSRAEQLGRTYAELVRTRPVLGDAAQPLGLTADDLLGQVTSRPVRDTRLLADLGDGHRSSARRPRSPTP